MPGRSGNLEVEVWNGERFPTLGGHANSDCAKRPKAVQLGYGISQNAPKRRATAAADDRRARDSSSDSAQHDLRVADPGTRSGGNQNRQTSAVASGRRRAVARRAKAAGRLRLKGGDVRDV